MGQSHSIEGLPKDTGINESDTEVFVPSTRMEKTNITGDGGDAQACESFYNNGEVFMSMIWSCFFTRFATHDLPEWILSAFSR